MNKKLPKLGQRILRSVAGVALCFFVYFLRGKRGIPFYSALAVLQCIQPNLQSSTKMAKQRTVGTMIGAFWGTVVLLIEIQIPGIFFKDSIWGYVFISLMTGVVLYTTVLLKRRNESYFSCVVFLSIAVMHLSDPSPFVFVFNRVIDTLIGVIMAVFVNSAHLPRIKHREILFVSGIDEALLDKKGRLSDYSKVELNRLIDDGAKFTVSTMWTPASIIEKLPDIHFKLPIIAMDGAALFDIQENSYILAYFIKYDQARKILDLLEKFETCCFINVIVDDMLLIYYTEISNAAEKDIFSKLRKSPHRNYIRRRLPENEDVNYIMMINESAKMQRIYEELKEKGMLDDYKILMYPSNDYEGFSYIKIYNKDATRENMLENLKAMLYVETCITFGSIKDQCDVWISNSDGNVVVKKLKQLYEPIGIKY